MHLTPVSLHSGKNLHSRGISKLTSGRTLSALLAVILLFVIAGDLGAARTYVVKWGDSLWGISKRFGVSIQEISSTNKVKNPRWILVGQKLIIPDKYQGRKIVTETTVTNVGVKTAPTPKLSRIPRPLAVQLASAISSMFGTVVDKPWMSFAKEKESQPEAVPDKRGSVEMLVGESRLLSVSGMSRTAVGDPAIADVVAITNNELLINGKSQGRTSLFIWDKTGLATYNVVVLKDTSILRAQIDAEIGSDTIKVKVVNDTAILEGTAETQKEADRAEAIAKAHAKNVSNLIHIVSNEPAVKAAKTASEIRELIGDDSIKVRMVNDTLVLEGKASRKQAERALKIAAACIGDTVEAVSAPANAQGGTPNPTRIQSKSGRILDMIERSGPAQIQVKAKVVEISRTALKDLGVEWGSLARHTDGVPNNPVSAQPSIFSPEQFVFGQINRGGDIQALDILGARLRLMVQNNQAKILSEPNVVVMDGNKANIIVGGEIPIPVAQEIAGGVASISVEFKEFGIMLDIEPTVANDGRVIMHVKPEVSTLDFENGVIFGGIRIPALRTRRADSVVTVADKETLIIGGLVSSSIVKQVRKLPILGDLPVLGALFRSTNFEREESDLVIFISPEIIEPKPAAGG